MACLLSCALTTARVPCTIAPSRSPTRPAGVTPPATLQPVDFARIYRDANPDALDLMTRMLKFNPADRISVDAALAHPYLASLHDPAAEPAAPSQICLGFEDDNLDGEQVRERMFREITTHYRQ